MQIVNKIGCINNAGFALRFRAAWAKEGETAWTEYFSGPRHITIDLTDYDVPDGAEVWIDVEANMGKFKSSDQHVKYSLLAEAFANYKVTGTPFDFQISLEGQ